MRSAAFCTLGCKVNQYETDAMEDLFAAAGYEIRSFKDPADVYVVNTCSVTSIADRKSRQMLHRARKMSPEAIVVAVGCYVQTAGEKLAQDEGIDLLIGNNKKSEVVDLVEDLLRSRRETGAGTLLSPKSQPESGALFSTGSQPGSGVLPSMGSQPKSGVLPGTESQPESGVLPSTGSQPKSGVLPGTESQPESGALPGPKSQPESGVLLSTGSQPGSGVLPGTENQPGSDIRMSASAGENRPDESPGNPTAPSPRVAVMDISRSCAYEELHVSRTFEHTRAYIKIQDGCNQFCSYCIIPYARGRVRSRAPEDILAEARAFVHQGYQEIVLTGIHISSYGMDFLHREYQSGTNNTFLIGLIEELGQIQGLKRIRLSSLEPGIVTEEFACRLHAVESICPHFHLSLQSGCDTVLKRMNRKYTTAGYENSCRLLRKYFSDPALTTDVIAGFPGETPEEFSKSLDFLEKIGFAQMHIFKYSLRQGTRAAQMPDQIPEQIKNARSEELFGLDRRLRDAYVSRQIGRTVEILTEEPVTIDGREYMAGYTREYVRAVLPTGSCGKNDVIFGTVLRNLCEDTVICKRID